MATCYTAWLYLQEYTHNIALYYLKIVIYKLGSVWNLYYHIHLHILCVSVQQKHIEYISLSFDSCIILTVLE